MLKLPMLLGLCSLFLAGRLVRSDDPYPPWDGNPHNWDRQRRCDLHPHYDPPCGLCEGIGGIVWGDPNDQIKITKCEKVATADQVIKENGGKLPPVPQFNMTWKNDKFYQILIGDKTNPFCFGSFPGPDSTKDHCYTPGQGTHYYDWPNYRLAFDLNNQGSKATLGYNTTSKILHQKEYMWIDNDLRIFEQCICSNPGVHVGVKIYPIRPDFMVTDSKYLGRESLFIEYLWKNFTVDHWIKGPHHIWVDPSTNLIIRMWQPWNGLQVLDPTRWVFGPDSLNQTLYQNPPPICKKGGATMRIHCNDDGTSNQQFPNSSFIDLNLMHKSSTGAAADYMAKELHKMFNTQA